MQIKTIKKTLIIKLNDWLLSIENTELRKKVKGSLLVSGGSITSMLLNEPINDYDLYFQDIDVLKDLCKHYAKGLNVKLLDKRDNYDINPNSKNQWEIALRTLQHGQIRIYFSESDIQNGEEIKYEEPKEGKELPKYRPLYISPNAITLSDDIQIVCRFTGDAETIHKTFDYIHATCYFTFSDGLVTNQKALESILTKQLFYQGSEYPLTSIIRMKKFLHRGWRISAGEILKILFDVSLLDLENIDVLEHQLIGVDVAYFSTLISILRKDKEEKEEIPFREMLLECIDKLFNDYEEEIIEEKKETPVHAMNEVLVKTKCPYGLRFGIDTSTKSICNACAVYVDCDDEEMKRKKYPKSKKVINVPTLTQAKEVGELVKHIRKNTCPHGQVFGEGHTLCNYSEHGTCIITVECRNAWLEILKNGPK